MNVRSISLVKDGLTYVFRYQSGCEDEVVDEIMRMVEDEQNNLDWFDAARLSFQVAQYAAADCCRQMKTAAPQAKDGPWFSSP